MTPSQKKYLTRNPSVLKHIIVTAILLCLANLPVLAQTFSDDFNDGNDSTPSPWTHYAPLQPPPWNEQVTWTFPSDSGGFAYRIFGGPPDIPVDPAQGNNTGPARVGSMQNIPNADFFAAVDLVNWDDKIPGNVGALAFRVSNPGFLTTVGYFAGYSSGIDWKDEEGIFAFVEFQTELTVSGPNETTGGAALVSKLNPTGKYRMTTSASGANLRAALYNRTDLLEPIVKIGANNADIASGTTIGLVSVSYDDSDDKATDFTYDNFYTTGTASSPVGPPGTPQVVELVPAPQTLYYTILPK